MYRLVVIDDEYIVVQGIKALISRLKLDYEVVGAAYDGIQGLEVIRSEKPDVVITDIRIPGLDGLSVIEAAKEERLDVVLVGRGEAILQCLKNHGIETLPAGVEIANADDVVDICRVADDRLIGESPEMVRHFMEIRGIGIIDIRAMYGVGSVILSKSIDMVIHMEKWDSSKEYDRLGLTEETVTILGVKVPYQTMPVRPGRNLAIIIEVAARNLSLKRMGYSAAHELDRRLNELIAQNSGNHT